MLIVDASAVNEKTNIANGRRLTSWLFAKRVGVEFWSTEHESIWRGREDDLNPGPQENKSSVLTTTVAQLPQNMFSFNCNVFCSLLNEIKILTVQLVLPLVL